MSVFLWNYYSLHFAFSDVRPFFLSTVEALLTKLYLTTLPSLMDTHCSLCKHSQAAGGTKSAHTLSCSRAFLDFPLNLVMLVSLGITMM